MIENSCPNIMRLENAKRTTSVSDLDCAVVPGKKPKLEIFAAEDLIWNGEVMPGLRTSAAGRIMRVEIRDFQCFAGKFSQDLQPSVNFITGLNGSGKSTFAKAIAVGFGSLLNRKKPERLSDFIARPSQKAEIRIHVNNQGRNAFRPELFGSSVIVERKLTRAGGSQDTYALISGDESYAGRGSGKRILQDALRTWQIQMDNPVFYLDQEDSKQFFQQSKPTDLFKFYDFASGLATARDAYGASSEAVIKSTNLLNQKSQELEKRKKELRDLEEKRKTAVPNNQYRFLQTQNIMWEKKDCKKRLDRLAKQLVSSQNSFQNLNVSVQENELTQEDVAAERQALKARNKYQAAVKKQAALEKNLKKLNKKIKPLEDEVQTLTARLKHDDSVLKGRTKQHKNRAKRKRISSSVGTMVQKKVDKATEELRLASERREECQGKIDNISQELEQHEDIDTHIAEVEEEVQKLKRYIHDLKTADPWETALSEKAVGLRDAVDRSEFKSAAGRLIGPAVSHTTVTDATHQAAVDQVVTPCLSSYALAVTIDSDTHREVERVRDFCRSKDYEMPALALMNSVDEGTSRRPAGSIDDPDVGRLLEAVTNFKRCVITDDDPSGLLEAGNVRKVCNKIGNSFEMTGGYLVMGPSVRRAENLSRRDRKTRRRQLQEELDAATSRFEELTKKKSELGESEDELASLHQELANAEVEVKSFKRELDELRPQLDVSRETPTEVPDDELEDAIAKASNRLGELKPLLAEAESDRDKAKAELEKVMRDVEKCRGDKDASGAVELQINAKKAKLNVQRKLLAEQDVTRQGTMEQIQSTREDLQNITQRLQERGVTQDLEDEELVLTQSDAQVELRRLESARMAAIVAGHAQFAEECDENIARHKKLISAADINMRQAVEALELAETNSKNRQENMTTITNRRHNLVQEQFNNVLADRGMRGHLEWTKKNEFIIRVNPTGRRGQDRDKWLNLEQLSGGERAYAVVALLVALWDQNAPFRILDEVECYMDPTARMDAIKSLVKKACADDSQCIFLTPTQVNLDEVLKAVGPDFRSRVNRVKMSRDTRNNVAPD